MILQYHVTKLKALYLHYHILEANRLISKIYLFILGAFLGCPYRSTSWKFAPILVWNALYFNNLHVSCLQQNLLVSRGIFITIKFGMQTTVKVCIDFYI